MAILKQPSPAVACNVGGAKPEAAAAIALRYDLCTHHAHTLIHKKNTNSTCAKLCER